MKKNDNTSGPKINEKLFFVQHFLLFFCILAKDLLLVKIDHRFDHSILIV
jgi:hypothetical protein